MSYAAVRPYYLLRPQNNRTAMPMSKILKTDNTTLRQIRRVALIVDQNMEIKICREHYPGEIRQK